MQLADLVGPALARVIAVTAAVAVDILAVAVEVTHQLVEDPAAPVVLFLTQDLIGSAQMQPLDM
jgi:hypothetical protein